MPVRGWGGCRFLCSRVNTWTSIDGVCKKNNTELPVSRERTNNGARNCKLNDGFYALALQILFVSFILSFEPYSDLIFSFI